MSPDAICIEVRLEKAFATCCGVNLASDCGVLGPIHRSLPHWFDAHLVMLGSLVRAGSEDVA